ncbi:MAG: hypothetical protein XD72_1640 [Methanothrix harundinacea]|uniref:Uncharacterized protein n=1 Tax=Methanothrix harundinacea TaxID=301375 RepID=A0A101FTA0_9EURY|nr:MAG: hypothetical protein XD72_1640 [Methanothrix harundinacea]
MIPIKGAPDIEGMLLSSRTFSITNPLTSPSADSVVSSTSSGFSEIAVPTLDERVWLAVAEAGRSSG